MNTANSFSDPSGFIKSDFLICDPLIYTRLYAGEWFRVSPYSVDTFLGTQCHFSDVVFHVFRLLILSLHLSRETAGVQSPDAHAIIALC